MNDVIPWLLDSDPALRWHVERDLAGEPESVWQATRARVATEGFGAQLLAAQGEDGQWAGGAHFPGDFSEAEFEKTGQPWTATSWSLNSLREWGVPATSLADTADKLAAHCRWEYDDLPFWGGEVDACINAMTLASGAWLGVHVAPNAQWFADHQLADGGWNCEWVEGSTRSSFHSTLNSLKGLLYYEKSGGGNVRELCRSGEEYLLSRNALRRATTGEIVNPAFTRLFYPNRWRFTVLRAADYFREASLHDGTAPDPRLAEAIEIIRAARQPDGRWLQEWREPGRVWFDVDVPVGEPSKWVTLSATRVLEWWDGAES